MESDREPDSMPMPRRNWPTVVILVAVVAVVAGAVTFIATRGDDAGAPAAIASGAEVTPASLRACVTYPILDGTETVPPDGTYVGKLTQQTFDATTSQYELYLDDGGAGVTFPEVKVADDVTVAGAADGDWLSPGATSAQRAHQALTYATSKADGTPSITVEKGEVISIDPTHERWDTPARQAADPCHQADMPSGVCKVSTDPVSTAWPDGVNGSLGKVLSDVPTKITAILAAWGVEAQSDTFELKAPGCSYTVSVGDDVVARVNMVQTEDGYFLSGITTDPDDGVSHVSFSATGPEVTLPIYDEFRTAYPRATVVAHVRYADATGEATAPVSDPNLVVKVDRAADVPGAVAMRMLDVDGTLRRVVAFQVPAGDTAAG